MLDEKIKDPLHLRIKNMVCQRCIMAVQEILQELNIGHESITLGDVVLRKSLDKTQVVALQNRLQAIGFELLDDKKARIIQQVKTLVIQMVHYSAEIPNLNLSVYIAAQLHVDYTYVSHLFSEVEGRTIEQFTIAQKIEKVKELLAYDEKSLSEISDQLGYSSVAYLSAQFKKQTGLTPTFFKKMAKHERLPLDKI